MKKIGLNLLIFILFSQCLCFANSNDIVNLIIETDKLATPISKNIMLENANQIYGTKQEKEEIKIFEPEEDLGESKIEKAFYKFVNNKVVNNKLNIFSMQIGEKFEDSAN